MVLGKSGKVVFVVCAAGPVQALALSEDCTLLATAGHDSTVFLFKVATPTDYQPMGFFSLKQPASCMAWAPGSAKLLIGCRFGEFFMSHRFMSLTPFPFVCVQFPVLSYLMNGQDCHKGK